MESGKWRSQSVFTDIFHFISRLYIFFFPLCVLGTEPGVTPGEFSVDQGGAANYTIPIAVPPGTAGMQPSLSLSYNSQSGNGLLGVSWTLGGLSVITRCNQTIVQDGINRGVQLDDNDRFCIDGHRLISINGLYGADLTEYRTEIDTFIKVISLDTDSANSGPEKFKVWTKSGQIMEYGFTTDSRIEAQGKLDVHVWAVSKISDTAGNYISFVYDETNSIGEYLITGIQYTGNENANPSLAPYASVNFEYESREDELENYVVDSVVRVTKTLKNIKMQVDESLVRDYQLNYSTDGQDDVSLLVDLTECAGINECFSPIKITWQLSFGNTGVDAPNEYYSDSQKTHQAWFGDVDGDGAGDFVTAYANGPENGVFKLQLSESQSFTVPVSVGTYNTHCFPSMGQPGCVSPAAALGDVNGDGLADLVTVGEPNYVSDVRVRLSNGNGFDTPVIFNSQFATDIYSDKKIELADINGDGLDDLLFVDVSNSGSIFNNEVDVLLSTGNSFTSPIYEISISEQYQLTGGSDITLGDVNGDGLADLITVNESNQQKVRVRLSNGNGFNAPSVYSTALPMWLAFTGDLNGDGRDDLITIFTDIITSENWLRVQYADGLSYTNPASSNYIRKCAAALYRGFPLFGESCSTSFGIIDVSGDGLPDLIQYGGSIGTNNNGWTWSNKVQTRESSIPSANLVSQIMDTLGHKTGISYSSLEDNTVYHPATGAVYPNKNISSNTLNVVSKVVTDDGLGGLRETNYFYTNGVLHVHGRGFLGFATMAATDTSTGITTVTTYRQDHPYIGFVARTEQVWDVGTPADESDDVILGEIDTTYSYTQTHTGVEVNATHPGVLFPYNATVTKKGYELD